MNSDRVQFRVTELAARVTEGVPRKPVSRETRGIVRTEPAGIRTP